MKMKEVTLLLHNPAKMESAGHSAVHKKSSKNYRRAFNSTVPAPQSLLASHGCGWRVAVSIEAHQFAGQILSYAG